MRKAEMAPTFAKLKAAKGALTTTLDHLKLHSSNVYAPEASVQ